MLPVLIPLGNGSIWQDNELRYSLRSIAQFISHSEIIVIGHKPNWLTNVTHIPAKDEYGFINSAKNIHNKILQSPVEDFILWNDDYFALQPINLQNYHSGHISEKLQSLKNNLFANTVRNTIPYTTNYFDIHYPMVMNLSVYKNTVAKLDWSKPYGYCIKSLYATDGIYRKDVKLFERMKIEQIQTLLKHVDLFSLHDTALNSHMRQFLKQTFPNPSRYELT